MKKNNEELLNGQNPQWEKTYTCNSVIFGEQPSEPARKAAAFKQEGMMHILELGGGQGRDTIFFAKNGFTVTSLDYAAEGVKAITDKAVLYSTHRCDPTLALCFTSHVVALTPHNGNRPTPEPETVELFYTN